MSTVTVQFLIARLTRAEAGWDRAMARSGYREPEEGEPALTPTEWKLYFYADAWRDAFHQIETALLAQPEVRQARSDLFSASDDGEVFFEAETTVSEIVPMPGPEEGLDEIPPHLQKLSTNRKLLILRNEPRPKAPPVDE